MRTPGGSARVTRLDIRGTRCPMNMGRVRLALEEIDPGVELKVVLDPGEGMENVPRGLREQGHAVEVTAPGELIVRKGGTT